MTPGGTTPQRITPPFEADERATLTAFLDVRGFRRRGWVSLRWVLTHMIEEYARHNGHADLLRERLDGSTGE